MPTAEELISLLNLQPHPKEGGFFRETYRCDAQAELPGYDGPRCAGTAIYYLLTPTTFSALHRLASDEVFHFYGGGPVQMLQLFPEGQACTLTLGPDLKAGQMLQLVVPRGVWQGSFLLPGAEYGLLGCTVAPGFEYVDYETGERDALIQKYPRFAKMIRRLTQEK